MISKAKIFIIDDEEDICHFSKSILEKTGKFHVTTFLDPLEAIARIKEEMPDLILLDLFMPKMDGSKVAERLLSEERTKDIPIVFLTALVKDQEVKKDGKIAGRVFIPKPVAPEELVAKVSALLHV